MLAGGEGRVFVGGFWGWQMPTECVNKKALLYFAVNFCPTHSQFSLMSKNLVIVESPAKAKTIEGFLGKDFIVKSSYGHVRDLRKKGLSVDVDHNFEPEYEISPEKKKVIEE